VTDGGVMFWVMIASIVVAAAAALVIVFLVAPLRRVREEMDRRKRPWTRSR